MTAVETCGMCLGGGDRRWLRDTCPQCGGRGIVDAVDLLADLDRQRLEDARDERPGAFDDR